MLSWGQPASARPSQISHLPQGYRGGWFGLAVWRGSGSDSARPSTLRATDTRGQNHWRGPGALLAKGLGTSGARGRAFQAPMRQQTGRARGQQRRRPGFTLSSADRQADCHCAAAPSDPPCCAFGSMVAWLAGFLQKKGGGTSLLGSKGWSQRYVRIEVRRMLAMATATCRASPRHCHRTAER